LKELMRTPRRRLPERRSVFRPVVGGLGAVYRGVVTYGAVLIVGGWIAAAVFLPGVSSHSVALGTNLSSLLPPHSRAVQVEDSVLRQFRLPLLNETSVVVYDPEGLPPEVRANAVTWALSSSQQAGRTDAAGLSGGPRIVGALPVPVIRDDIVVTYLYFEDASPTQEVALAHRYARHFAAFPGVQTFVTGLVPAQVAQHDLLESKLNLFRLLSVVAVTLIVTVTFRSLLPAGVVLMVAGIGYVVAEALLGRLGRTFGFSVPDQVEPLVVALILGVVTDYSMLLFQDFRERLAGGIDHGAAMRQTLKRQLPVITIAGLTVTGGTAALLAARLQMFRAFGPALAVAVLVGLVVSVTLTPALLTIVGHRLFRPGTDAPEEAGASPHRTWLVRVVVAAVSRRTSSLAIVLVATAGLLLAAYPLLGMRFGASLTSALPQDAEARQGMSVLADAGIPGVTAPTEIVVERRDLARDHAALARLQHEVADQRGVVVVYGPADNPTHRRFGVFLAERGNAARFFVAFDSDPLGADAISALHSLQERLPRLASSAGLSSARIGVTGQTAIAAELTTLTVQSLVVTVLAAMAVALIILAFFLRALLAPIAVIAASALTVAAALGLTTWLFQDVIGVPGLTFYAPFATAVLLLSLESDYNVFAVGNIWHDAQRRTLRGALRAALPRSSRAISAAGFILATTMGIVAVIPIETLREVAFTMAAGLLIDTLVIRPLVTPALLTLLGRAASWPSRRIRTDDAEVADARDRPVTPPARSSIMGTQL
jgi:RND superfamily putative drug exporter